MLLYFTLLAILKRGTVHVNKYARKKATVSGQLAFPRGQIENFWVGVQWLRVGLGRVGRPMTGEFVVRSPSELSPSPVRQSTRLAFDACVVVGEAVGVDEPPYL